MGNIMRQCASESIGSALIAVRFWVTRCYPLLNSLLDFELYFDLTVHPSMYVQFQKVSSLYI